MHDHLMAQLVALKKLRSTVAQATRTKVRAIARTTARRPRGTAG
jgi:hypothetical protein